MNAPTAPSSFTQAERPTAVLFHFPFPGPWRDELAAHSRGLANDIAAEEGLLWKMWLENWEAGRAGGFYLFAGADAANRYRIKHERRLRALGLADVESAVFEINASLSAITGAAGALGRSQPQKQWINWDF